MPSREDYAGMTVNERLVAAGLADAFDEAVLRDDRSEMIRILERVDVRTPEWTVDTILANPTHYGYRPEGPRSTPGSFPN